MVLTPQERKTLNKALEIIERHTARGASWYIDAARFGDSPFSFGLTYFDSLPYPYRGQHSFVRGETFADKVETALGFEAGAADNKEKQRQERIAKLRAELEKAEQVSA